METTFKQMKKTTRLASVTMILLLAFTTIVLALGGGRYPVDGLSDLMEIRNGPRLLIQLDKILTM